ncbi:MAG: plastocyanin/azurin family copper-binding protein [Vicinamibacteraceae bacterium]
MMSGCTAVVLALGAAAGVHAQAPRVVAITGTDAMKYSVAAIEAKPGEKITVKLTGQGAIPKVAMAHNFVLLAAKTDAAAFSTAAASARATDFIPAAMKDKVLASTKLAGTGETVEVTFDAPKEPGVYTYLCTFPGHFMAGMKGTLTVK